MIAPPGPGLTWLAARTGESPEALVSSPLSAVRAALGELAALAVRAESEDPRERGAAEAELAALREEVMAAPRPSETYLTTLAGALREVAERLSREGPGEGQAGLR